VQAAAREDKMRTAAAAAAATASAPAAVASGKEAQVEEGTAADDATVVEAEPKVRRSALDEAEREVRRLDAVVHVLAAALADS